MPEGDTIFRTAEVLRAALAGRRITAARAQPQPGLRRVPDLSRLVGASVERVDARGKHLLIGFDDGHALHTHMGMHGTWRLTTPGPAPRGPSGRVRALVEVKGAIAECRDAPVAELLTPMQLRHHPVLAALGPDLCSERPDLDEVLARLERLDPSTEIGVALLDQRVAAGIGNVYKSEVLFANRVDPTAPVGTLDRATRRTLYETATAMLRRNLGAGRRTTAGDGIAVYGKAGQPCPRCGSGIRMQRQGGHARITYRCPSCQRSGSPPAEAAAS